MLHTEDWKAIIPCFCTWEHNYMKQNKKIKEVVKRTDITDTKGTAWGVWSKYVPLIEKHLGRTKWGRFLWKEGIFQIAEVMCGWGRQDAYLTLPWLNKKLKKTDSEELKNFLHRLKNNRNLFSEKAETEVSQRLSKITSWSMLKRKPQLKRQSLNT